MVAADVKGRRARRNEYDGCAIVPVPIVRP